MPTLIRVTAAAATVAAAFLSASDADAATVERTLFSNPAGLCQASLPAFEGQIRKRPLAIQNEGTANAFITCSFSSQSQPTRVAVYVASSDGATHEISCTAVTGYNTGTNQYVTKSITVSGSGIQQALFWRPNDFAGGSTTTLPDSRFNLLCNLVPGAGINDSQIYFDEEVGS